MKIRGGQRQFLIAIVTLFTPALANAETTYVVAAGLIDTLNEKYIENPVVEIEGHRIVSVTENGSAPNGAAVIDLSDSTLVPGLADVHAVGGPRVEVDGHASQIVRRTGCRHVGAGRPSRQGAVSAVGVLEAHGVSELVEVDAAARVVDDGAHGPLVPGIRPG